MPVPKTYAIDFDGTLCKSKYPDIGDPIDEAIDYVKQLQSDGHQIILWTCRSGDELQAAVDWCGDQGITFDAVNENTQTLIDKWQSDPRKVGADYYIDDKATDMKTVLSQKGVNNLKQNKPMSNKFIGPTQVMTLDGKKQAVTQIFEVKQAAGKTLNLFVYDEIKPSGTDWYTGETVESETSSDWFRKQLEENSDAEQINLFINSVGGYVTEAMGIRAHLLRHKANKDGYVDGWAASAASFLLTACDTRNMLTGSMQFIHEISTIAWGTANDFRQMADQMDRQMVGNRQMYLERAGDKLTEEKLIEMMKAETWLNAQECIDLGLADRIIQASEYKDIVKQTAPVQTIDPPADPIPADPIPQDPDPAKPEQKNKILNLFAAFSAEKG